MKLRLTRVASAVALLGLASPLMAAPADTASPYYTDPQNVYVQDATSDGVNQLNMVLCIMNAMRPAEMLDQKGTAAADGSVSVLYSALVDQNKCDSSKRANASNSTATSSAAEATPSYMNAVVNVSRASNSAPMIAKVWLSFNNGNGMPVTVDVRVAASQSPTDVPPYGVFRLDYAGQSGGLQMFNGFIDSSAGAISYFERNTEPGNPLRVNGLTMAAASTTSGAGTMAVNGTSFDFAYDSALFRRSDTANDVCFNRSIAQANKSVWSYGTYDAVTGARVDTVHPGFPIVATKTADGSKVYGYAGYWGLNLQGVDLGALPDGLVNGYTITDQRPNNTNVYSLSKVSGKLTQWSQGSTTLDAVDGIPMFFWGNLSDPTNPQASLTDNPSVTGFNTWQAHWDKTTAAVYVTGKQSCNPTGCVVASVTPAAKIGAAALAGMPLSGWSDAVGGNVNVPSTGVAHVGTDSVTYYTQNVVLPGSAGAPTDFYCMSNCPTAASLAAFTGMNGPFGSGTGQQWMYGAQSVHYTFDGSGLKESGAPVTDTNPSHFSSQYMGGVMTGRLFTAPLTSCTPPYMGMSATVCEPQAPATYYTWETGVQSWNQSTWLTRTSNAQVMSFDPPRNIQYPISATDDPSGVWVGKTIQLQFNGFGNLFGIPGSCVNPVDNQPAPCDGGNVRFVPVFALTDGATMTLPGMAGAASTPLIVKALNAEVRLGKAAPSACAGLALSPQTLPSAASLHDPSSAADPFYIGPQPGVSGGFGVIHGVIQ
ncbi:MAG: hypothetical protein AB3X37_01045 [Leptothrix ochracea]|uniref:hypothetical protein n=1 Tax=Leptothrix ochracea TaxID=735331 RepID=UPI0034E2A044